MRGSGVMCVTEAVRLVVWDLDETFWKGTLTEGGIQEYVRAHHDIVIELARRGIMSSICSKNDFDPVMAILKAEGIADYFIFPSISWEPKGMRLAQLVETVQLRAPTVMFIDDNPNNRGEAAAIVPGLQVEDETFIDRILDDPRFKGKDDHELSRLKQYKLLEERKRDEEQTTGGNEDFLRSCDVRVQIDYDVEANIDRAIELINRTNQLNFTKNRLPEDIEAARTQLRGLINGGFGRLSGLIRVADKYGDYGYVGFFLRGGMRHVVNGELATASLIHFCFSCRTLGMGVEQWVYEHLSRPALHVVGEVLTNLSEPRTIDWIREVQSIEDDVDAHEPIAPQIILHGGCETAVIAVYLQKLTPRLDVYGSYVSNGIFVCGNVSSYVSNIADRDARTFAAECKALGLAPGVETGNVFATAEPGALFVANFTADAGGQGRIRHKQHGWIFLMGPDGVGSHYPTPEAELKAALETRAAHMPAHQQAETLRINRHVIEHYDVLPTPSQAERADQLHDLIRRIPAGSKFILVVPHHRERRPEGMIENDWQARYRALAEGIIEQYPFAACIAMSDLIYSDEEITDVNHYRREVYTRVADRIAELEKTLEPKAPLTFPLPTRSFIRPDEAATEHEALFSSETVAIFRNFTEEPPMAVACFQPYVPTPGLDKIQFGRDFMRHFDLPGLFTAVSANHWYQTPDITPAIRAMRDAAGFARLATYGSSKGAYAAILHSRALAAEVVIAVSPQFSIDREKAPFEPRWAPEASTLTFDWDDMAAGISHTARIFILYDSCTIDALHARAIADLAPNVQLIPVPFSDHPSLDVLLDARVMKPLFRGLLSGELTARTARRYLRRETRRSPLYWANLGLRMMRRKAPLRAIQCLERADGLHLHNDRMAHNLHHLRELVSALPANIRRHWRGAFPPLKDAPEILSFDLTSAGGDILPLTKGWCTSERDGCWMRGDVSLLPVPIDRPGVRPIWIELHISYVFRPGEMRGQEIIISTGDHQIHRQLVEDHRTTVSFLVEPAHQAAAMLAGQEGIQLTLIHPDAISPAEAGINTDARRLCLMASSLVVRAES